MAEVQQFAPILSKQQTKNYIKAYDNRPHRFNESDLERIRQHAQYHNVPFYEGDFSIIDAVGHAASGFFEGFTTLNVSKKAPDNTYEAIAKNIGHLIGFAPGILAGPLSLGGRALAKTALTKSNILLDASKFLAGKKGLPLLAAEKYITPRAAKLSSSLINVGTSSKSKAMQEASAFLLSDKAKHIAEGAFNLGAASALSSWQGGVDSMIDSFFSGAVAGGVFRTIGNQINAGSPRAEKFARGLAGSIFMGVPSTLRGATTPEQVYEYLMGAYFGGSEKPWTVARAMPIAQKVREKALKSDDPVQSKLMDPRVLYEKWDTLAPELKKEVLKITEGPGFAGGNAEQIEATINEVYNEAVKKGMAPARKEIEAQGKDIRTEVFKEAAKEQTRQVQTVVKKTLKKAGIKYKPDERQFYVLTTGQKGTQAEALKSAKKSGIASVETIFPTQKEAGKADLPVILPRQELVKSNQAIEKAVKSLNELGEKVNLANLNEYARDGIRRDYRNVEFSKQVVAVDTINPKMTATRGLSKYAVQMAINANKRVNIYDKTKGWLKYDKDKKKFVTTAVVPELGARTAFFGKKALDATEKMALQSMFDKYEKIGFKQEIVKKVEKKEDTLELDTNNIRDIGESSSSFIDNKMSFFMNQYLRPELKKTIKSIDDVNAKIIETTKVSGELALDYLDRGSTKNRSYEWVEAVEEKSGIQIPQALKNKMRQWVAVQNQGEVVRFINADGKKVELSDKENPFSLGGKSKLVIEPKKPFEYAILDAINIGGKEYDLSKFEFQRSLEGFKPNEIRSERKYFLNSVIKGMDKKGYHMYGGVGDKDRIVFVKYHPNSNKVKLPKFTPSIYTEAKNRFLMDKAMHDKAARSIIAHEEAMNGLPISEMVGKKGKFIQNAVEANKRAQIWFTNGISGDKEFINNPKRVGNLNLSKEGNYKTSLIVDPKKVKNILNKLNIELPQHVDGAIIVTDKVLDAINLDAGVPYSGQNKSFIISKNKKGTILGKFMFHKAGPELSEAMEKANNGEGINFLAMSSAIKQSGNREPGDYIYKKGQPLELTGGAKEIIEIRPGDLKYSQSVINDHKMMGMNESQTKVTGVTFVKQMGTNLHPDMYGKTEQSTINNIFNELSQRSFDGKTEINNLVREYNRKPSKELIEDIIENFDNVGVKQIEETMKTPGSEKLAQEMFLKILKVNKQNLEQSITEGELTGTTAEEASRSLMDFYSTADNIVKHLSKMEDAYPMFFDKYTKNYVNEAVNRFVAERVLKPKVKNAIVARMRPYDKALQQKFPELNKNDEIFYLGDLYKKTIMFTNIPGLAKTTLGKLWSLKETNNPKYRQNKEQFEEIFEAINVRVPQDSPSGAQVLKFKGFTGIKDHGVLSHGRSMEAQGGADLDGDESFIYFGGRNRDGIGEGMKQSWKDMYKAQKKEFYTKDEKAIKDAKEQYRDQIVVNPKNSKINPQFLKQVNTNPEAKYSPVVRAFTGLETASNRGKMGPVVTMVSNMRGAWSSLRASKDKFDIYQEGEYKDGRKFRITMEPREPSAEQRDLTKALVNFTADPANEAGLISIPKMQSLLMKAYYTGKHETYNPASKKWSESPVMPGQFRKFTKTINQRYKDIKDFNSAYFSRNFEANRAYSAYEKQEMTRRINKYEEPEMTTFTMKFANTLKDVNMNLSIFNRLDYKSLKKLHDKHNAYVKNLNFYKELLGRTGFKEKFSDQIDFVLTNDLFVESTLKNTAKDGLALINQLRKSKIEHNIKNPNDAVEVENYLRKLVDTSEDYLSNAFHNISTLERVMEIYQASRKTDKPLTRALMKKIRKEVELLKGFSAFQYSQRSRKGDLSGIEAQERMQEKREAIEFFKEAGVEPPPELKLPTRRTKIMDNAQIDARIKKFKESLPSKSARDMFDTLFIGSLRSPEVQKALDNAVKNNLPQAIIHEIFHQGSKTNTTKAAFDSKEISSENIIKFFKTKNKYYLKSFEPYKEIEADIAKFERKVEPLVNKRNIRLLGTLTADVGAYEGITKPGKKISPENQKVVQELFEHLKMYSDAKGKDISQLLSGIYAGMGDPFVDVVPKKLNQMNIADFKLINNWFRQIREGNMFQRMETYKDALEKAGVKKRWWLLFPKQVNSEQMAHDIKFLPAEGYFKTKDVTPKLDKMYRPTYYGEVLQNWIGRTQDLAHGVATQQIERFNETFKYLDQVPDGSSIWRLGVRKSELKQYASTKKKVYKENWEKSRENNDYFKLRKKKYSLDFGDGKKVYSGYELVDMTMNKLEGLMKEYHTSISGKLGALAKYRTGWYDPLPPKGKREKGRRYETQPILDYKSFINDLNIAYKKGQLLKSDDKKVSEFLDIGIDGMRHMARSMLVDLLPVTEYTRVIKGKEQKIGVKKYYSLSKAEQKLWKPDKAGTSKQYEDLTINTTGYREGYYPHYFYSNKELKKSLEKEKKALENNTTMNKKQKAHEIEKLIYKYKHRVGDWDYADFHNWKKMDADLFKETLSKIETKELAKTESSKLPTVDMTFGNMKARDNHMPGWMIEPMAVEMYINNVTNTYFRQLGNIMSRYTLHSMRDRLYNEMVTKAPKKDKDEASKVANGIVTFWKKYASEAMGNPVTISQAELSDPYLKLSGTPYALFADNLMAKKLNKMGEMLGFKKSKAAKALQGKFEKGTAKAKAFGVSDKEIKKIEQDFKEYQKETSKDMVLGGLDAFNVRSFANVEGKYQLATLMTHPKTMINNIFGGTMHTFQSVGGDALLKARNIDYLQGINPKFKTKENVEKFVRKFGIQPEMLQHEFGLQREFRQGKAKAFVNELVDISKKEGFRVSDLDISAIAKRYGVSNAIMTKAAKFMTIPEFALRRDSFMAHYIKAYERFGGAITNPEHPYLIEIAKKGVKATQFLYNAPYRMPFARSAFGKIMTRFQLWSFNAVRFRNDARKAAKLYDFAPGTEATKRLERILALDMFVMALSGVFMYSMFEQTLPAPWNWLQDSAEWIFGDEKERDRAFFGTYPTAIAPLQIITPPIARFPISVIREFAEDDYTKLSDYYMWTMFPFGRILRDTFHPESGIINNPMRLPEKVAGFPLTGLAIEASKIKKSDRQVPIPGFVSSKED